MACQLAGSFRVQKFGSVAMYMIVCTLFTLIFLQSIKKKEQHSLEFVLHQSQSFLGGKRGKLIFFLE